ncbi:FAD-dependent oxidoreductase [Leucobacter tenebrionis]|uniref:FAD-dependent oxidoreductase n=1 Tax=Leucobacter tenebrionis TaxID=2873270 RepID=UPI0021029E20|nr:FAD-dependent oxidoreductase [Leucobacter tenebrionis]
MPTPAPTRREQEAHPGHVIVAWDTGDRARELLALPEQERFDAALAGVRKIVGDEGIDYVNASNYHWREDEFAYGAYATGPRNEEVLYRPINDTVFWCGAIKSSVGAAHSSGLAAAEQILKSL